MKFGINKLLLLPVFVFMSNLVLAQSPLSFRTFMNQVKTNHPIAFQAALVREKGEAYVLKSRGGFDPKLISELSDKYYQGTEYYQTAVAGFKVPTWFGVELQTMVSRNTGYYLNPQNNTPSAGLYLAGISVPIGQGLWIDERRTELKKAKVYSESTAAEQQIIMNDLMFSAGKAYWDWYRAYRILRVYEEALELTESRFSAVLQSAQIGERPFVDTLEAGIQVQNRKLSVSKARLDFKNETSRLSVYLWDSGSIPLEPADDVIPDTNDLPLLEDKLRLLLVSSDSLVTAHPELLKSDLAIDIMQIERRWKAEQLKPDVRVKYNALSHPVDDAPVFDANDYNWGFNVSYPILLRKERGALKVADIEIESSALQLDYKRQFIRQYMNQSVNTRNGLEEQLAIYSRTATDYGKLLDAERQMFLIGESSLFLVNMRELGFIQTQLSWFELEAKFHASSLQVMHALGVLGDFEF